MPNLVRKFMTIARSNQQATSIAKPLNRICIGPFLCREKTLGSVIDPNGDKAVVYIIRFAASSRASNHFAVWRPGWNFEIVGHWTSRKFALVTAISTCGEQRALFCGV